MFTTVLCISHLRRVCSACPVVLAVGDVGVLRLQLPPHAGHLLVGEGHHGHAGLQALPALTLAVLLLVLDAALANLLVPLPGIFPCGRLGVVVYVVTAR